MTKKPGTPQDFAEILGTARRRETTVGICLAGDLSAEADRISAQLATVAARPGLGSLADVDPRIALEAELAEVHELMRQSETQFRFQALPRQAWRDLLAEHPPRPGKEDEEVWNPETIGVPLIAACAIDPVMTVDQVEQLLDVVNQAGRNLLFNAAYEANTGPVRVPFSPAASPNLSSSGTK